MSGRRWFIDTAFVQALFNRADQYHDRARRWVPLVQAASELWTTEAVLVEVGNALSAGNHAAAVEFIRELYQTASAHVVTVDTSLLLHAVQLYESRADKQWGLTDCI